MPPAQKKETPEGLLKKGSFISIEASGRTVKGLEVLDVDDRFVKLRWNPVFPPETEVVLVPLDKCLIGLEGER